MKLGILSGYSPATMKIDIEGIRFAESLGFDSAWTAEAYGSDAVSPAAWILAQTEKIKVGTAIMQMPARSPAAIQSSAIPSQYARFSRTCGGSSNSLLMCRTPSRA